MSTELILNATVINATVIIYFIAVIIFIIAIFKVKDTSNDINSDDNDDFDEI
jgi:hypothetical protein